MMKIQSAWMGLCLVVLATAACSSPRPAGVVDGGGKPTGVAVDNAGNIYIADRDNFTIRKVTTAGVVTTLAGTAGMFGSVDGTGTAARFSALAGVVVDGAGNIYVADEANHTIRKVTATGDDSRCRQLQNCLKMRDQRDDAPQSARPV